MTCKNSYQKRREELKQEAEELCNEYCYSRLNMSLEETGIVISVDDLVAGCPSREELKTRVQHYLSGEIERRIEQDKDYPEFD